MKDGRKEDTDEKIPHIDQNDLEGVHMPEIEKVDVTKEYLGDGLRGTVPCSLPNDEKGGIY